MRSLLALRASYYLSLVFHLLEEKIVCTHLLFWVVTCWCGYSDDGIHLFTCGVLDGEGVSVREHYRITDNASHYSLLFDGMCL